jgi:hypothetical protein
MCLSKANFFTSPIKLLANKYLIYFCLLPFRIYLYICLLLVCTYTLYLFIYLLCNNSPVFSVFINAYTIPHLSSILFTSLRSLIIWNSQFVVFIKSLLLFLYSSIRSSDYFVRNGGK